MTLYALERIPHTAPTITEMRRRVDWTKVSNDNLKFALDVLELHHNPEVSEVLFEIQRRACLGQWLDIENPPPPLHNLPFFLTIWPFKLLWKQRPR
jgi:hypothetical protein